MANKQNLVQNQGLTREEARALSRKGGIKSGETRRARKTLREELIVLLQDGNIQEKVSLALIQKALNGDVRAFEVLRDTIGEKPIDKVEQTTIPIVLSGDDELES